MMAQAYPGTPGYPVSAKRKHSLAPLVVVGVVVLLLGVVFGVAWAVTTPAMTGTVTAQGAAVPSEQLGEEFAGVAVFALWMLAYGAVAAALAWFAARYWRGLIGYGVTFVTAVIGTVIAESIGTWVGHLHFPIRTTSGWARPSVSSPTSCSTAPHATGSRRRGFSSSVHR